MPGGGKLGVDARSRNTKRDAKVAVPSVGRGPRRPKVHAIDRRGVRRKSKAAIMERWAEDEKHLQRYRPPLTRPVATDQNKRMLQATFQFKGGKCLPEAGTMQPLDGNIPLHIITGKGRRDTRRAGGAAEKSSLRPRGSSESTEPDGSAANSSRDARISALEQEFDEIMGEIDERKDFLDEMGKEHGAKTRAKYERDIQVQLSGLVRRARDVDTKLKKLLASR